MSCRTLTVNCLALAAMCYHDKTTVTMSVREREREKCVRMWTFIECHFFISLILLAKVVFQDNMTLLLPSVLRWSASRLLHPPPPV